MAAITAIELNKSTLELAVAGTETLVVTKTPEDGEGTITWESSDPTVASVEDGVVTALKAGEATITASAGENINATCAVTVTAAPEPEPEPDPEPETEEPDLTFFDDGKIPMGILYVNTVKNVN